MANAVTEPFVAVTLGAVIELSSAATVAFPFVAETLPLMPSSAYTVAF